MSDSQDTTETTLNIPQLAFLLIVAFLAIRWVFSPRAPAAPGSSTRGAATVERVNPRHVETVVQMFPQLDRRTIMWDLQRNGNNVQMTTERVLAGRRLETPPQSFQPILPQAASEAPSTRPVAPTKSAQPDLIKRYNLDGRLQSVVANEMEQDAKPTWSTNKTERQTLLQKRREEMILAARRKLQQKESSS